MMRNWTTGANRDQLTLLLFVAVGSSATAFAQGTPVPLTVGTVVTGQCNGKASQPGCVLPSLYGSTGLSLYNNPVFPHYAHFIGSAQTTLNQTLSTSIATQLTILPIISPASGFTYKYDSTTGAFERSTTTLGPIYTERAETIGRGRFYFGTSYQRFRFDKLDGIDLTKVPAVFAHIPNTGPNGSAEPYESDVIQTTNDISLHMDQTMLFGTVGVTDRLDVSVAVPLVSVRMGASSNANIIRVSGPTFSPAPGVQIPNPHEFNAQGATTNSYSTQGDASGLGDVIVRIKSNILRSEGFRVALAMDVRTPTGDPRRLLGSGSTGIKPFLAISAGKRISPHVNVGYQWNSPSILAGNVTGSTVSENASGTEVIQNGAAIKGHVPANVFYSFGADMGLTSRFTLVFDYLGQAVFNSPRVFESTLTTATNIPGGTGALDLATITGRKETVTLNSGAAGIKCNLFGGMLLTADLLFRMDDHGLRQNVTPLIALSKAFGK